MFSNAWNVGTISGIKIRVHWSFLIIPILAFYTNIPGGTVVALTAVSLVFAVFGCVLLHELGHALAARQFGIGTRDILLLPIGGVASLNEIPRQPLQELWIAVAGPLVNVVIAAMIYVGLGISGVDSGNFYSWFLSTLAFYNLFLVVFNLIPAFPMDGGRIFRSLMAMFLPYTQATSVAATVGKYCSIAIGLYGLINGQLMLILLAAFVYFAGQAEKMQVMLMNRRNPFSMPGRGSQFRSRRTQDGNYAPKPQGASEFSLPASLSGHSVAVWLNNRKADCCSIVESGEVIGKITKAQLMTALSRGLGNMPVGKILMLPQS